MQLPLDFREPLTSIPALPMTYDISLRTIGILAGLWLVISHGYALWRGAAVREWLSRLPRSRQIGIALLTVDGIWAFAMIWFMDLGEFSNRR
jgi:hypothetical protein